MKSNNSVKFILVIIIITVLTYVTFSGSLCGIDIPSVYSISPGIDINGGISATLYADTANGGKPTQAQLESAKTIIDKRLDNFGILDRNIATDIDGGSILLEIPWKSGETDFDPDKTLSEVVKTALLTFQEVDPKKIDNSGKYIMDEDKKPYIPEGQKTPNIIIQGTDVLDATPEKNPETGGMQVSLRLSPEGVKKFAYGTREFLNKPIAIYMDDQFIEAPKVDAIITDGKARIIMGNMDDNEAIKEAKDLADTIRAGSLPFKMEARMVNSISPLLGKSALNITTDAAVIAFILVCLFMLIRYRLPGILACIALLGHTVLQLLFISCTHITLTLPGLAGIIITIGMGVDANIIIFERMKEELRNEKTLHAAIDTGFKRAFTAILDANVTTLIAAVALFIFGTGAMLSFAYTLGLGVLLSFLTAVMVSRILIKSVANFDIAKHHWLYGI